MIYACRSCDECATPDVTVVLVHRVQDHVCPDRWWCSGCLRDAAREIKRIDDVRKRVAKAKR